MATRQTTAPKTVKKTAAKKEETVEVKAAENNPSATAANVGDTSPCTGEARIPEIEPEETVSFPKETPIAADAAPAELGTSHASRASGSPEGEARTQAPAPAAVYQEPMVKLIYLDSCIENNQIPIGGGRVITGSGRRFSVKLSDFEGVFLTPLVSLLLKKRKFIVLDGLNEEQRQQYGVDYKPGEILKNEGMFDWFLSGPVSQVKAAFADLCKEHRELVASRFMLAFENGDNRLTRDRIEALNEVSKRDFEDGKGAFTPILKAINEAAL